MGADVPNKTAPSSNKNGRLACACMVDMFAVPCSSDLKSYFSIFELVDFTYFINYDLCISEVSIRISFMLCLQPYHMLCIWPSGWVGGFSVSITVSSVDPIIYQFACVHPRSFTRGNPISLPAS